MTFKSQLLDIIEKSKIISIIGLAKNVSKTTTLNHVIRILKGKVSLGLTSIGRDGEKYDIISYFPKPRIFVEEGTLIASAQESLDNCETPVEIIKDTGISTPMGNVLIVKVLGEGYVELAGPSINIQLSKICNELIALGCDLIIVDGAFDRRSYATPLITDATILSTGASVSENMEEVIELTIHTVKLLTLENEENQEILNLSQDIIKNSKIGIIRNNNSVKMIDVPTALDAAKDIIKNLKEDSKYIVIKGAVSNKLLEDLMKLTNEYKGKIFLVEDGTKLFLSKYTLDKFEKKGGILKVLNPICVAAITINPTSPSGYEFDKTKFIKSLEKEVSIPVFDLGPSE
jgi:hypothetical protein